MSMRKKFPGSVVRANPVVPTEDSAPGIWTLEQQNQNQKKGTWPFIGDPNFKDTILLLHGDTSQQPSIEDKSSSNHEVTVAGDAKATNWNPFNLPEGYWSTYFTGSNAYLSFPNSSAFAFGTGAFTIEFWFNGSLNNDKFILSGRAAITTLHITFGGYGGSTAGSLRYVGSSTITTGSDLISDNTWHHVAIERDGSNNIVLYIDGVSKGTGTDTTNYTTTTGTWYLGANDVGQGNQPTGYFSNFRIVKGSNVYGGAFSSPSFPLTPVINTQLLILQSNRFVDNSTNGIAVTSSGGLKIQPLSPFSYTPTTTVNNYGSYYFDGTNDYLQVTDSDDFNLTNQDFTIEFWVYSIAHNAQNIYVGQWQSGQYSYAVLISNASTGNLRMIFSGNGSGTTGDTSASTGYPLNTWRHCALVRDGSTMRLFQNGVQVATVTAPTSLHNSTAPLAIGAASDGTLDSNGYISNVRFIKGRALYTSTFTPPTKPIELTLTEGENSVKFDGTDDYLTVPNSTNTNIGGYSEDYTVSCWFNLDTITSAHRVLFGMSNGGGAQNKWLVGINMSSTAAYSANKVGIYSYANASARGDGTYSPGFLANNWYYFTLVYTHSNTTLKAYINGTEIVSVSSNVDSSTGAFTIGTDGEQNGDFIGHISNFRLVKGQALETTVPEAPFSGTTGVLLACASRYIEDRSPQKLNVAANGNAVVSGFNPFNEGYWSVDFDGVDDELKTSSTSSDFAFGTGDFTVECFIRNETINVTQQAVVGNRNGGNDNCWCLHYFSTANRLQWHTGTTVLAWMNTTTQQYRWYHVAVARSGTTLKLFLDGVETGSFTDDKNYSVVNNLFIGYDIYAGDWNGQISNLRIIKGTALYTSSFTAPTEPLTTTSQGATASEVKFLGLQSNRFIDNSASNHTIAVNAGTPSVSELIPFELLKRQTKLLNLQNNQDVNNNSFQDSSTLRNLMSKTGNATQGTFSPFSAEEGKWSNYFGGSSDFEFSSSTDFNITTYVTFECWVYFPTLQSAKLIAGREANYWLGYNYTAIGGTANKFVFTIHNNSSWQAVSSSTTPAVNTWYHIMGVKDGTTLRFYLNGTQENTATFSGSPRNSAYALGVGGYDGGSESMTGYVSNVRLVTGSSDLIFPYSGLTSGSSFTAPTKPIETPTVNGEQSVYFDGNGDRLTVVGGENIGTGDFTISAWVYRTSSGTYPVILDTRSSDSDTKPVIYTDGSNLYYYTAGAIRITGSSVIINNVWHFVRLVRSSGVTKLFLDGSQVGSDYSDSNNYAPTNDWEIGSRHTNQHYWYGYISNLQFVLSALDGTSVPTAPFTADANTKLLTCQSKSFIDESDSGNVITANGDAAISYFNPFNEGYWSFYSDGAGHINSGFTLTDTGSYTYEGWVKPTADNSGYAAIFATVGNFSSFPGVGLYANNSSPPRLHVRHGGTTQEDANGQLAYNTWYFVKVVYDSSAQTLTTFLDGTQIYQNSSVSANAQGSNACLFYQPATGNQKFHGYISNWRFRPVVDSSTTVPTEPFDPSVSNTEFLFQSNRFVNNGSKTGTVAITGTVAVDEDIPFQLLSRQTKLLTSQSNRFKDEARDKTITVTGSPKVFPYAPFVPRRSYSKDVVGGSLHGDASDMVEIDGYNFPALGTADFTIEAFVYFNDGASNTWYDTRPSSVQGAYPSVRVGSNAFRYYVNSGDQITGNTKPAYAWYHVAVVRSSGSTKLYVNGTQEGSTYSDSNNYLAATDRPRFGNRNGNGFNGYLSNLRVVTGTAIYTSNFTPPTSPVTRTSDTKLLMNFTDGAVIDNTGKNNLETIADAKVSSYVRKFGNGSMYFDGTGDYLVVSGSNPSTSFFSPATGDFTWEMFVRFSVLSAGNLYTLFSKYGSAAEYQFFYNAGNHWNLSHGASTIQWADTSIVVNTWYHIALVKDGTDFEVFRNGTSLGTVTHSNPSAGARPFVLGATFNGSDSALYFLNGYLDDVRITKGVARYISPFTAPTRAFKNR